MNEFLAAVNWDFIAGACVGAIAMGTGCYVGVVSAFKKNDAQRKEAMSRNVAAPVDVAQQQHNHRLEQHLARSKVGHHPCPSNCPGWPGICTELRSQNGFCRLQSQRPH